MTTNGTEATVLASLKQHRKDLQDQLKRVEKAIRALEPDAGLEQSSKPTRKPKRKRRSKEEAAKLKEDAYQTALAHPEDNPAKIHQRMVLEGMAEDTPADISLIKQEMLRRGYRARTNTPVEGASDHAVQGQADIEVDRASVFG